MFHVVTARAPTGPSRIPPVRVLGRIPVSLEVIPRHPPFGPLACFPLRLRHGEAPLPRLCSEDYHAENRDTDAEAAKHRPPLGALPACPHMNVCAIAPTRATPLTERSVRRYSDVQPRRRLGIFSESNFLELCNFLGDQDLRRRHNKPTRTSETRANPPSTHHFKRRAPAGDRSGRLFGHHPS